MQSANMFILLVNTMVRHEIGGIWRIQSIYNAVSANTLRTDAFFGDS